MRLIKVSYANRGLPCPVAASILKASGLLVAMEATILQTIYDLGV